MPLLNLYYWYMACENWLEIAVLNGRLTGRIGYTCSTLMFER